MKHKFLAALLLVGALAGCKKDLLDKTPKDSLTEENVWTDNVLAEQFVNGIYSGLPYGFGIGQDADQSWSLSLIMLDAVTDDGETGDDWTTASRWERSDFTASSSPIPNRWGDNYGLIRRTNITLANAGRLADGEISKRMRGEAFFLRAYLYHDLLRFYGAKATGGEPTGVPLVLTVLKPTDDLRLPRATYDATVAAITADCDSAFALLPAGTYSLGRATKAACLALKSRVLLYAERWAEAATVANQILTARSTYNTSLSTSLTDIFLKDDNPEIIFAKRFTAPETGHQYDDKQSPAAGPMGAGWGTHALPTQNLVDEFEMLQGFTYNPQNPYVNRDRRFAATVLFNGATFRYGNTYQPYLTGDSGPDRGGTRTGYNLRKFMDVERPTYSTPCRQPWVYMRLAEVLLNYAEAQNEAAGPSAAVYNALDELRTRGGIAPISRTLSQSQLRDAIRKERRVELAFEEHRYFDVRRWGVANTVLNAPIRGVTITRTGANSFTYDYSRVVDNNRKYFAKNRVLPIPQGEIDKNPNAKQILGW